MAGKAETIAGSITALRAKSRLTQRELSEKVGVSQGTVANWEQSGSIKLEDAWKLADFFGVPLCEVAGRVEVSESIPNKG